MRLSKSISIVIAGCMIAGCTRDPAPEAAPPPPPGPVQPAQAPPPSAPLPGSSNAIADVAAKVTPSVVSVFSERGARRSPAAMMWGHPWLEDRPSRNLGSGVIVGADGVILTNNHVIADAEKVRVALQDGRELEAKVVGTDPESDIAVLRIAAKNLPAIEIADSSRIRIGDVVLAIGNPFGIGQTVTMGIISAVGRANMGITDYEDFIQTDAAINPGNSGGALVDMTGKLVGVNTAIASRSGGYMGIGFAIPSNMAMQVKTAILQHGKVKRGYLGVSIQDVTPDLAKSMSIDRRGVLVSDVTKGSPAAKAGLARGDVILSIDGRKLASSAQLRNAVALGGIGSKVRLEVMRDGKPRTVDVTLAETPVAAPKGGGTAVDRGMLAGITVQPLDRTMRQRLRVPPAIDGVVVTNIDPDTDAAALGLAEGDIIVELNRKPVKNVDAFRDAAKANTRGVLLLVYRDGATLFLSLQR